MKKILPFLFMIVLVSELRAQQLIVRPSDSLLFKGPKKTMSEQFELNDSSLSKSFTNLTKEQQLALLPDLTNHKTELFYSNMPVIKVAGNIDNMPVAKAGGNIDGMLIKSVKVVRLKDAHD